MSQSESNSCNEPGYIKDLNVDAPPPYCGEMELDCNNQPIKESHKSVAGRDFSWLEDEDLSKLGNGANAQCDPMQSGHIINDQLGGNVTSDRNYVYRYSKAIRGCDEGALDLFRDIIVIDEQGKAHNVPIIWATQEAAVAAILQDNVRKDASLVVDRIRLPMLAIHSSSINWNPKRYVYHRAIDYLRDYKNDNRPGFVTKEKYERDTVFGVARGVPVDIGFTLWAWTLHREDMNQIVEQIMTKFSPIAYIRVRGVSLEVIMKLDSVANNIPTERGDKDLSVYKFEWAMTAETYIPQPLVRKKAVLKTKIEIGDSLVDGNISEIITKIEESVKELHD